MRHLRRIPFSLLACLALAPLLASPLRGQESSAVPVLGPGDGVRLEFLADRAGEAPRIAEYTVDDRGRVLLPVVGLVQVGGRDFGRVRSEVEAGFDAELVDVAVRLTPLVRVAVLGEVRSPGLFSVDPSMRLSDVLAAAGGLTELADREDVRLIRTGAVRVVGDQASVASLEEALRSGDQVVVGRRSWMSQNLPFVLGAGSSVLAAVLTAVLVR